jgi:hypothetical protein
VNEWLIDAETTRDEAGKQVMVTFVALEIATAPEYPPELLVIPCQSEVLPEVTTTLLPDPRLPPLHPRIVPLNGVHVVPGGLGMNTVNDCDAWPARRRCSGTEFPVVKVIAAGLELQLTTLLMFPVVARDCPAPGALVHVEAAGQLVAESMIQLIVPAHAPVRLYLMAIVAPLQPEPPVYDRF